MVGLCSDKPGTEVDAGTIQRDLLLPARSHLHFPTPNPPTRFQRLHNLQNRHKLAGDQEFKTCTCEGYLKFNPNSFMHAYTQVCNTHTAGFPIHSAYIPSTYSTSKIFVKTVLTFFLSFSPNQSSGPAMNKVLC